MVQGSCLSEKIIKKSENDHKGIDHKNAYHHQFEKGAFIFEVHEIGEDRATLDGGHQQGHRHGYAPEVQFRKTH
jgi:hypothetical protein